MPVFGILVSFALICDDLWRGDPARFTLADGNPINEKEPLVGFLAFAVDKMLGVVLLDAPASYGLTLSGINHRPGLFVGSLVFSYNVVLSLGLARLVITWYQLLTTKSNKVSPKPRK